MDIRTLLPNLIPILTALGWALVAYLILLWAASVLWTYRDIHARSEDVLVQVLAVTLALVLPFAGVVLHLILRPRQTLAEKYERTLEEEYDLTWSVCPYCGDDGSGSLLRPGYNRPRGTEAIQLYDR